MSKVPDVLLLTAAAEAQGLAISPKSARSTSFATITGSSAKLAVGNASDKAEPAGAEQPLADTDGFTLAAASTRKHAGWRAIRAINQKDKATRPAIISGNNLVSEGAVMRSAEADSSEKNDKIMKLEEAIY